MEKEDLKRENIFIVMNSFSPIKQQVKRITWALILNHEHLFNLEPI